jgi:hypothetical protein
MSISVYSVFVLSYAGSGLQRADLRSKIPTEYLYDYEDEKAAKFRRAVQPYSSISNMR